MEKDTTTGTVTRQLVTIAVFVSVTIPSLCSRTMKHPIKVNFLFGTPVFHKQANTQADIAQAGKYINITALSWYIYLL